MQIHDLATYILHTFSKQSPDGITPMKLQKLLFYVKAWGSVAGKNLLDAPFYKWEFGPVNKEIYQEFKSAGASPIVPSEKILTDFIVENYIDFSAIELSKMSHCEAPWIETAQNAEILDKTIKDYYSTQWFAKNFPLNFQNSFYPVMSNSEYSFVFDMSKTDAEIAMTFPSYENYKQLKVESKNKIQNAFKTWLE